MGREQVSLPGEAAPRGAGVPSYAGAPHVSVQPLSGWA